MNLLLDPFRNSIWKKKSRKIEDNEISERKKCYIISDGNGKMEFESLSREPLRAHTHTQPNNSPTRNVPFGTKIASKWE